MTDINSITLGGRLTKDAELRYGSDGNPWSTFAIAVNASMKTAGGWED